MDFIVTSWPRWMTHGTWPGVRGLPPVNTFFWPYIPGISRNVTRRLPLFRRAGRGSVDVPDGANGARTRWRAKRAVDRGGRSHAILSGGRKFAAICRVRISLVGPD